MKKHKKPFGNLLFVLLGATTISSVKKTKTTEKDGIEYTYIKKDRKNAQTRTFLGFYNLQYNGMDSVIYTTEGQPMPGLFNGLTILLPATTLWDNFPSPKERDSIVFNSTAKNIFGQNVPPFLKRRNCKSESWCIWGNDETAIQAYLRKMMSAWRLEKAERAVSMLWWSKR